MLDVTSPLHALCDIVQTWRRFQQFFWPVVLISEMSHIVSEVYVRACFIHVQTSGICQTLACLLQTHFRHVFRRLVFRHVFRRLFQTRFRHMFRRMFFFRHFFRRLIFFRHISVERSPNFRWTEHAPVPQSRFRSTEWWPVQRSLSDIDGIKYPVRGIHHTGISLDYICYLITIPSFRHSVSALSRYFDPATGSRYYIYLMLKLCELQKDRGET